MTNESSERGACLVVFYVCLITICGWGAMFSLLVAMLVEGDTSELSRFVSPLMLSLVTCLLVHLRHYVRIGAAEWMKKDLYGLEKLYVLVGGVVYVFFVAKTCAAYSDPLPWPIQMHLAWCAPIFLAPLVRLLRLYTESQRDT